MISRSTIASGYWRIILAICLCWGLAWPAQTRGDVVQASSLRLIVRLRHEPLAKWSSTARSQDTATAQLYAEAIDAEQREVCDAIRLRMPGAIIEYSYRVTFNGLAVRLHANRADAIRELGALAQVSAVYEEDVFTPALYASVPYIGTETLWSNLGGASRAGAGVRIAILDSGINIAHPMFDDASYSYPPGYPKGDVRYTSRKVIVARTYLRPYDLPIAGESTPLPGSNGSGHGTHIAGIAAGNTIAATYRGITQSVSGVAPRAYLMNYRIFYPTASGGPEVAYTAEVLRAIEDAVSDGAQVLCNAWSNATPRPPLASPEAEALGSAMDAGCVVVAPAGNGGPGYGSASRTPGGIERVITVGASSKDRIVAWDFVDVTGPTPVDADLQNRFFGRAEFGANITTRFGPYPYADVSDVDPIASTSACSALPAGSLAGKVALISRGGCYFADKAYVAQQAGARLALIYNDTDDITEMGCAGDHCDAGDITIPAALISQSYGRRLLDWLDEHPNATVQLDPNARIVTWSPDVLQSNSGRGPAYARFLKPDLVAPGAAVLSAYHATGDALPPYEQISGTSVACAHVAGAAALLLQAHPTWSHDTVKSALIATANRNVYATSSSNTPTSILGRGAGRVDLSRASNPLLICTPASISLGQVQAGVSYPIQITLSDPCTNGCAAHTYTLALSGSYGMTLNAPAQVTVGPKGTATLHLTLRILADAPAGDIEAELGLTSGNSTIYVPIWAYVTQRLQTAQILLIDNDSSAFDSYADYSSYVTSVLDARGITYVVWNADARFGNSQTVPDLAFLQQYRAVIWLTGDNSHPDGYYTISTPLTAVDQQILASYLDAGGRMLAIGQNLAEVSDVNGDDDPTWGRSMLYHNYLGSHWLQGSLFDPSGAGNYPPQGGAGAVGLPDTFLSDVELHLGRVGDGARNQSSIDEIAPGGLADGSDRALTKPLIRAVEAQPQGDGIIGLAKAEEPTLEDESIELPYRILYYSFGIEGINTVSGMTTRNEFLGRSVDWLLDDVTVTFPELIGSADALTAITCQATSSRGAAMRSFRWQIGEGDDAHIFETDSPTISYLFSERGSYPIAVEVTDALGHQAVARGTMTIAEGGGSTLSVDRDVAISGDIITYQATVYNSGVTATNASLSLPLPTGTEYISHLGGNYASATLVWSGNLPAGSFFTAELRAKVREGLAFGSVITATANFQIGADTFTRSVSTQVLSRSFAPVILNE